MGSQLAFCSKWPAYVLTLLTEKPEEARKDLPLEPSEHAQPWGHPYFRLLASRTGKEWFLIVLSLQVCGNLLPQLQETNPPSLQITPPLLLSPWWPSEQITFVEWKKQQESNVMGQGQSPCMHKTDFLPLNEEIGQLVFIPFSNRDQHHAPWPQIAQELHGWVVSLNQGYYSEVWPSRKCGLGRSLFSSSSLALSRSLSGWVTRKFHQPHVYSETKSWMNRKIFKVTHVLPFSMKEKLWRIWLSTEISKKQPPQDRSKWNQQACAYTCQKHLIKLQVYVRLRTMWEPVLNSPTGTCQSSFRPKPTWELSTEEKEKSTSEELGKFSDYHGYF